MIDPIYFNVLVYGALISMLCLGFTLTHMTAKIPNFAHGVYAAFGIYTTATMTWLLDYNPYYSFIPAFLVGGLIGIFLYKVVISTLQRMGGGTIVLTISSIAIGIFMTAAVNIYAYWLLKKTKRYVTSFLLKHLDYRVGPTNLIVPTAVGISILVVVILYFLLNRTNTGISMRAICEDPMLAKIMGIDTDRVQMLSWFLTGGLACLAGSMLPLWFTAMPATGAGLLLTCMAGSLLGGMDDIYGSVLGGYSVGAMEIFVTVWLQDRFGTWVGEYRMLIPMLVVIFVLLLAPTGLMKIVRDSIEKIGRARARRASVGGLTE